MFISKRIQNSTKLNKIKPKEASKGNNYNSLKTYSKLRYVISIKRNKNIILHAFDD